MVGAIVITHGTLAESLVKVLKSIAGDVDMIKTVAVQENDTTEEISGILVKMVGTVDGGKGVIIFTDMLGGTPSNVALPLLKEGKVDIMAGVNLPVLLKFVNHRTDKGLGDLALLLKQSARESIVLASDVLNEKK
jgi:PTS system mannose-specific IIA component